MFDDVTQDTFRDYIKKNKNVIVYFWTPWCGACRFQEPVLEQISHAFPNQIKIARIDAERNSHLALSYQVRATPTLLFFKNGKKVRFKSKSGGRIDRLVGA